MNKAPNMDRRTVEGFGQEWYRFDQEKLSEPDKQSLFLSYFNLVDWSSLKTARAADIGCGSGRWATLVVSKVGFLHLVDASPAALEVAKKNLNFVKNVKFECASVDQLPFPDSSLDFAYSLGVLHHVPDTRAAIHAIAKKVKSGGTFLIYLYYSFDNRPRWFRALWRSTEILRLLISHSPNVLKNAVCELLALGIYWPMARTAKILERLGHLPGAWPLSSYRDKEFYVMRTDSLDRFGTVLEQRFSKTEICQMLEEAGFEGIRFSDHPPYWVALGKRS